MREARQGSETAPVPESVEAALGEIGFAIAGTSGGGQSRLRNLLASVPLAAALSYAIARWSLAAFYDDFGTTPEEVGWDLTSALAAVFPLALALTLLAGYPLSFLNVTIDDHVASERHKPGLRLFAAVVVAIGVFVFMLIMSENNAARLKEGKDVSGVTFPVMSECVDVTSASLDPSESELPTPLILLGAADGTTVLFNPTDDATWRLPSATITIRSLGSQGLSRLRPDGT